MRSRAGEPGVGGSGVPAHSGTLPAESQTVQCPRAAVTRGGHHNNMQSAARGRPPRGSHCPLRPSRRCRAWSSGPRAHSKLGQRAPGGLSASPRWWWWGVSSDTAWRLRRRCLSPGHYPRYPARGAQGSRTPIPAVPPTTWSPNAEPRGARGRPSPRHFLRHRPRRG